MRLSIGETSKLTGISVRTLHYYDEINLLKPSEVTESGYRYYDDNALERLQQILFYRELDFPLKDIKEILSKPDYNSIQALKNHKELLLLKRKRLDKLIKLVENIIKGESTMEFNEFDMTEIEKAKEKYAKEVKEKWGDTEAYKENSEKTSKYKKEDWEKIQKEADEIFKEFSANKDKSPSSKEAQDLVVKWQNHITKYYYNCTKEILKGLGEMYIADERFTKNINKFGEGTAEFMSEAIKNYCS